MPENVGQCRSCGVAIRWAVTLNGKRNPLNFDPDPEKGNVALLAGSGSTVLALPLSGLTEEAREAAKRQGVRLYLSHFATCPNRAQHRKE